MGDGVLHAPGGLCCTNTCTVQVSTDQEPLNSFLGGLSLHDQHEHRVWVTIQRVTVQVPSDGRGNNDVCSALLTRCCHVAPYQS